MLIVASAKLSQPVEESVIETTGVREPIARIRKVNLSRLLVGMEWPRRTRSKSPSLMWSIASLIDPVDVTMNPADCQSELCPARSDESRPTARTTVRDVMTSRMGIHRLTGQGE